MPPWNRSGSASLSGTCARTLCMQAHATLMQALAKTGSLLLLTDCKGPLTVTEFPATHRNPHVGECVNICSRTVPAKALSFELLHPPFESSISTSQEPHLERKPQQFTGRKSCAYQEIRKNYSGESWASSREPAEMRQRLCAGPPPLATTPTLAPVHSACTAAFPYSLQTLARVESSASPARVHSTALHTSLVMQVCSLSKWVSDTRRIPRLQYGIRRAQCEA